MKIKTGNNPRKRMGIIALIAVILFTASGCVSTVRFSSTKFPPSNTTSGNRTREKNPPRDYPKAGTTVRGLASYYADRFAGLATASGEIYNPEALTAAHPSLPFGSVVRVRNLKNGRRVTVLINDRGPFIDGRIIDLSAAAAEKLDMLRDGIVEVELSIIKTDSE